MTIDQNMDNKSQKMDTGYKIAKKEISLDNLKNFDKIFTIKSKSREFNKKNRGRIAKSITRKSNSSTLQTTLFENNVARLKIRKHIENYPNFWKEFFPEVFNEHLAMNFMHTMGIADKNSPIINKKTLAKVSLKPQVIFPVFKKFNKLVKKGKYDDVHLTIYSNSIMIFKSLEHDFSLILDPLNKLGYSSNSRLKKQNNQKKHRGYLKKGLCSEIWGSSFIPINSGLLQKKLDNDANIFIRESTCRSLVKKLDRQYLRYDGYFSAVEINKIFEILEDYDGFKAQSSDMKENPLKRMDIDFSEGFIKLNPKFMKKRKKQWFLFLAARKKE